MNKLYRWLIVSVLSLFFIQACVVIPDDDLSKPVEVDLHVGWESNNTAASYMEFSKLMTNISRINFYGTRQEGSDIFFDATPSSAGDNIVLIPGTSSLRVESFDLPQGIYTQLKWELTTGIIERGFLLDELGFEYDDIIDELTGKGMVLSGSYQRLSGVQTLIFLAIDNNDLYSFFSKHLNDETSAIQSPNNYLFSLVFNPYTAIETIDRSAWENADTDDVDFDDGEDDDDKKFGVLEDDDDDEIEYILISSDNNSDLYERILFRFKNNLISNIEQR
jgi:hypothetical protein